MSNAADRSVSTRRILNPKSGLLLLYSLCLLTIGCMQVPPVVKIGLVGPFTGRYREVGYDVIYSARLAVRELNESGGIGGYRVALVALDDFGDPELAEANANALAGDPAVVAIVGNWLPETTLSATQVYKSTNIPYVATGDQPFGYQDPATLPSLFRSEYAAVTPFDEIAGPYAGSAYDAMQLVIAAMAQAEDESGKIDRETLTEKLKNLTIVGLTGPVYQR